MSKQHQVQKGVIHKQISPTTYLIKLNGEIKLCHLNQIKLTTLSDLDLKQKPSPYPTVDPLNLAMMQSSASTPKPQIQLAPKITNVISPSSPVKKQQPVPHTGNTRRALSFNETNAILPGTSNSRQTLRQSGTPQPHNSTKRPSVPQNSNSPEWQIESSSEQPSSSRTKSPEPPVTPPAPPPRKSSRESKPPMRLNL
nr:PREDICTED: leucine-rich repeat extensin-like protein 2 [Bemisia tabaci]